LSFLKLGLVELELGRRRVQKKGKGSDLELLVL